MGPSILHRVYYTTSCTQPVICLIGASFLAYNIHVSNCVYTLYSLQTHHSLVQAIPRGLLAQSVYVLRAVGAGDLAPTIGSTPFYKQ